MIGEMIVTETHSVARIICVYLYELKCPEVADKITQLERPRYVI
jgi:hypothetical protein